MDYATTVGKLQTPAGFNRDIDGLVKSKAVVCGILDQPLDIAAAHKLGDHVGLVLFLTQIEDSDDVGVGAEPAHGLGLPRYAAAASFVKALGLNQGEGYFTVQQGVVGQVDFLLTALAQEPLDLVTADPEGGGRLRSRNGGSRSSWQPPTMT